MHSGTLTHPAGEPVPGSTTFTIRNDEPAIADALDREKFARSLARVIVSCGTPLVVGLYGTWGIGKTSLMCQIEAELRRPDGVRTVWFDPWRHQFDEDPAVALLHTMVEALDLGDEGRKLLAVIASALGSVLLRTTTALALDDIRRLGEQYEEERFQLREKQVRLQEYFSKLIARATDSGRTRLVFFIDDLDRCVPETVLKVLEALKLYLNQPGCVYVIGVDRSALECSIKHRYKDQEIREADYLDKIVQLPFTIPPIADGAMEKFLDSLLPPALTPVRDLLVAGLGNNPRQIKRFVNALLLNHELAAEQFGERYDARILTSVLLIQYRQPELFKAAVLDPRVLIQAISGRLEDKTLSDMLRNDRRLTRATPHLRLANAKDIAPYIFLSEVAAVRSVDFDLVLRAFPPDRKVSAIRVVREITGMGIAEAKDLVEGELPVTVKQKLPREEAEKLRKAFADAGCEAELV